MMVKPFAHVLIHDQVDEFSGVNPARKPSQNTGVAAARAAIHPSQKRDGLTIEHELLL